VIDYVTPEMSVAKEEIFGPVISIIRTETLDDAIKIENANPYGNAASVFTTKRRTRTLRNGARVGGNDRGEHRCARSA
jgi:acyl-CoA reductase-like NAD-dependent aldehyde dehydrogenase